MYLDAKLAIRKDIEALKITKRVTKMYIEAGEYRFKDLPC
jgi:hypothetical protein